MTTNALLIRWANGWHEVNWTDSITSYGRREAYLELGAAQSVHEATRIGNEHLALYGRPRVEIAADLEPINDADTPYRAFLVGDFITVPGIDGTPSEERVVSMTVTEDEHGVVTYAPELKDRILTERERFEQSLKKMENGTLRGESKSATPVSYIAPAAKDCCPPQEVAEG